MRPLKRDASPEMVSEPMPKKRKSLGQGILSSLKRVFSKSNPQQTDSYQPPFTDFGRDQLPAAFTSQKRRMSVQENINQRNSSIPRASISGMNGYQALTNNLDAERQIAQSGLEHSRVEAFMPSINSERRAKYLNSGRDVSPTVNVPLNQVLPSNNSDMDIGGNTPDPPVIIEHEFAPLYKDEDGQLVRPPFINLDPRERYHLLQLKRSMEASEFLQSRLNYLIDPEETTSVILPDNKVDSTTQTEGKELSSNTSFDELRTKLALRNRRNIRNNKRVFSGAFFYEPSKNDVNGSTEEEMTGYLGKLSKPKFNVPPAVSKPKEFVDDLSSESMARRRKSVGQRAGLEESIRLGKMQDCSVDKDYLEKTERVSDIIKLKDTAKPAKNSIGPSSGFTFDGHLSAISSILDKRKANDEAAKQGSNEPSNKSGASLLLFGKSERAETPVASNPAPKFSFGGNKLSDDGKTSTTNENLTSKPLPAFSFGKPSTPVSSVGDEKLVSASSASTQEAFEPKEKRKRTTDEDKPSSSFESKLDTTSTGLFGGSSGKSELPKFSFGQNAKESSGSITTSSLPSNILKPNNNDSKLVGPLFSAKPDTKFSFGDKKDASAPSQAVSSDQTQAKPAPAFNFGQTTNTASSALPAPKNNSESKFSFGQPAETPKFLFGTKNTDSPNKDPSAPISFGEKPVAKIAEQQDTAPQKTEAPKFSFGAPTAKGSAEPQPAAEPAKFSFGQAKTEEPKFSFGQSKTEEPKFTFGQSKSAESKFSFGNTKVEGSKTELGVPSTNTKPPTFLAGQQQNAGTGLFGKSDTKEPTPTFSFSSKETTPKPVLGNAVSGFSFDKPAQTSQPSVPAPAQAPAPAPAPSFSFGQTALVNPALIFGAPANAPQPGFNFTASKESTPFKFGGTPAAATKPEGFSFSNNVTAGFGASRSATPSSFGFNGPSNGAASNPQFGGFNQRTASPSFNATPSANPAAFGGMNNANPNPNPDFGQTGGFSFTPNAMGAATGFNSAPGSFGVGSRENTPPIGFGAPGSAPGQPFTPPLAMQGRKFAQMRPRKRF